MSSVICAGAFRHHLPKQAAATKAPGIGLALIGGQLKIMPRKSFLDRNCIAIQEEEDIIELSIYHSLISNQCQIRDPK
jgi:hypothetical protein